MQLLFTFLCVLSFGSPLMAIALQLAIRNYNFLVGGDDSPRAVPRLSWGRAMAVGVFMVISNFGLLELLKWLLQSVGGAMQADLSPRAIKFWASSAGNLILFVITAWLLSSTMPTTFKRAVLVNLLVIAFLMVPIIVIFGALLAMRAG